MLRKKIIGKGDHADVVHIGNGQVIKAFKRIPHSMTKVLDWTDHDAMTRATFRVEERAYKRLAEFPDLELFAPKFFKSVDPIKYLGLNDKHASKYVTGCGILLEYIPGTASKLADLEPEIEKKVDAFLNRFRIQAEIADIHVWDASCFVPGARAEFTVIDFAT